MAEGMGEPHWFVAYSCALQWVGEAAHGQKWVWPAREALEVKVSPLVYTFWEETGMDLIMACIKLCWEPAPRSTYQKREDGPVAHIITFLDELVVWVPSLDAWDLGTTGPHRSRAVWLLLQPGGRPRPCDASSTIQGHRQSRDLLVHCEGPSV